MSITQQYLLDTYRAQQLGEPAPPAPGTHDWQVVRELARPPPVPGGPGRAPGPRADRRTWDALGRWLPLLRPALGPLTRPDAAWSPVSREPGHELRDRRLHVLGRPLQARRRGR